VAAFRDGHGVRAGDTVVALGYPLAGYLATNANLSVGNVSALAGLGDDSRYVQISAPVQPGNSGGPLLDTSGHIVGVVASRLNGGGVQNVNFALKAEVARTFLDSKGITYRTAASEQQLSPADVGEMARPFTVFIECQQKRPASIAVIARTEASPPSRTAAQWKDELVNYCRNLYKDKRLDAVRGVLSFADAPTLSQQRNPNFITNEQRPALDAWKELYEKCNNKLAAVNPQVWKFFRPVSTPRVC